MMQERIQKLLYFQVRLFIGVVFIAVVLGAFTLLTGLFAGGSMAMITTVIAMRIFRRLPKVIPAKTFYTAMVLNELIKWLVVVLMSILLLPSVSATGFIIGFMTTYMAYFGLIFQRRIKN